MKKFTFLIAFFISVIIKAQVINLNPDPNGPIWPVGALPARTSEIEDEVNAYPYLVLSVESQNTVLPDSVDNSKHKYMRPIFPQSGGSCGQAAGIAYTYTYEINRLRDSTANDTSYTENQYPPIIHTIFLMVVAVEMAQLIGMVGRFLKIRVAQI